MHAGSVACIATSAHVRQRATPTDVLGVNYCRYRYDEKACAMLACCCQDSPITTVDVLSSSL